MQNASRPGGPARPGDQVLRALLLAALAADERTAAADLRAGVLDGIAHLAGSAQSLAQRQAAETLARAIPGVRAVVNRIAAPGAPDPARRIDLEQNNTKNPIEE